MKKFFISKYVTPLLYVAMSIGFLFYGCGQKQEEKPADTAPKTETPAPIVEQPNIDTVKQATIEGTWLGKFDSRPATLTITSFAGSKFTGKIVIEYRTVINQNVEGEFNLDTKKFTMKDLLHSRYQGKYTGNISENMQTMTGTFTMDLDGKKMSFNFTKK